MDSVAKVPDRNYLHVFLRRSALAALLWWILVEGQKEAWALGIPVVLFAVLVSLRLAPPALHRLKIIRLPAFLIFFLWRSLIAGWDIARRIVAPTLPLRPGIITFAVTVPDGAPAWLLQSTLTLLPGTLSVSLRNRTISLHCLDTRIDLDQEIHRLQAWINRLFESTGSTSKKTFS